MDSEVLRIDEQGRKWKKIDMCGVEMEIEVDYKPVIMTPEEVNRLIKEYEDKQIEDSKKALEEYNKSIQKNQT